MLMRALSGIQPSGKIHLGNYFGAMRQHLELQSKAQAFYFIANFHALTTIQDPTLLRRLTLDVALDYLALGLDPEQCCLYRQSDVPQVTELSWLLSTVTPMGLLQRCHAYKDKVAKGIAADHGLFAYPVLMAADILIVDANIVPVGQDQKQHIEVTRDIAQAFNNVYGEVFVIPEPYILPEVAVVPGTDGQKMSKSYRNTIDVFATGKELKSQVLGIVTDSTPLEAPKEPEKDHVLALLRLFADSDEMADWERRYRAGGTGYGHAKLRLLELVAQRFSRARERRAELSAHPERVEAILQDGARRARTIAQLVLSRARQACGID
jgi:tryptophanyl-tRNA synthetase